MYGLGNTFNSLVYSRLTTTTAPPEQKQENGH